MLTEVPIPSKDGIKFHPLKIYRTNEGVNPPGFNLEKLPIYAEAYDVHTNFVYVNEIEKEILIFYIRNLIII